MPNGVESHLKNCPQKTRGTARTGRVLGKTTHFTTELEKSFFYCSELQRNPFFTRFKSTQNERDVWLHNLAVEESPIDMYSGKHHLLAMNIKSMFLHVHMVSSLVHKPS